MKAAAAASGYAAALVELAQSGGVLDAVHSDFEKLAAMLDGNAELADFVASPVVTDAKKKEVLAGVAGDAGFHAYTRDFLGLLVDKKRASILKDVASEVEVLFYETTDTQFALVTSAVKLENSQQALIARKLQSMTGAKKIKLKNIVDPSLIAGFVVTYGKDGSSRIDMSVKGQLDRLAAQFEFADGAGVAAV
eukprot:SM000068S20537  [mRNA]  locus=s68:82108:82686:+ [translate_table: standard]